MPALPDPAEKAYLTVAQAAKVLGVNVRTIYNAIDRKECPAVRVGKVIRIPTDQFLAMYRSSIAAGAA